MKQSLFIMLIAILAACKTGGKPATTDSLVVSVPATELVADAKPDSAEILYYKKPFTDKERYTRFFSSLTTKDSGFIQKITALLQLPGVKEDSMRNCMSEGKINLPLNGDAYKVLYFSRAGKPCSYFYVIRNGAFYYYEMSDTLSLALNQLEKLAAVR